MNALVSKGVLDGFQVQESAESVDRSSFMNLIARPACVID
jgi:hypothetical protein